MSSSLSQREQLRCRILQASSDCKKYHGCKSMQKCVAENLQTSRQLVSRWVEREKLGEGVQDRPRSGAPRKLSEHAVQRARSLLSAGKPDSTLRKVAKKLVTEGLCSLEVSKNTVRTAVRSGSNGLRSRHVSSIPMLTEEQMKKRVAFAKENRNRAWTKVMFTDSKYFYLHPLSGRRGPKRWVLAGTKPTRPSTKFPSKVHVYAGVSYYGKTELRFATGTTGLKSEFSKTRRGVGAAEYQSILSDTLLPQAKQLFGRHSISDWIFQQDGAPAHTAHATQEFIKARGIQVLSAWPPNSPDLSWIENIWAWMEQELRKHQFSTLGELKTVLKQVWSDMPLQILQANCLSTRDRLIRCIEKEGCHTGY